MVVEVSHVDVSSCVYDDSGVGEDVHPRHAAAQPLPRSDPLSCPAELGYPAPRGRLQIDAQGQILELNVAAAYYDRGNCLYRLERFEVAIESYTQAIERAPDSWAPYRNRGLSHTELGHEELACRDRRRACELGDRSSCEWVEENCRD